MTDALTGESSPPRVSLSSAEEEGHRVWSERYLRVPAHIFKEEACPTVKLKGEELGLDPEQELSGDHQKSCQSHTGVVQAPPDDVEELVTGDRGPRTGNVPPLEAASESGCELTARRANFK